MRGDVQPFAKLRSGADTRALARHSLVLRHDWDAIGLGPGGPEDEYGGYVLQFVAPVLDTTANEAGIAARLAQIETEDMSPSPEPARAMRAARALLGLRAAFRV